MEPRPQANEIEEVMREKIERDLEKIFDSVQNGEDRVEKLMWKFESVLKPDVLSREVITEDEVQKILGGFQECSKIEDRNEFIERIIFLIKPLTDLAKNNPQEFEAARRKAFAKEGGFIPLNEILSYGIENNGTVHIHLAPAQTLDNQEKMNLLIDGFKKLAEVVKNNEEITNISATSWIVAKAPKTMQKFGFRVTGEISDEMKEKHFTDEDRPVHKAVMTREEFLAKYL